MNMQYINIKQGYKEEDVERVAEILKSGGVVIVPTDTVYGIAASISCESRS